MKMRYLSMVCGLILISYLNLVVSSQSKITFRLNSPLHSQIIKQKSIGISSSIPVPKSTAAIQKQPLYTKIFPIYPKELPKFFGLSLMMFWAIFVFTLARDTKDALIVTSCGAEAIAFLKVYGVIPAATLFMLLYSKLATMLSPTALFYSTLSPFMLFFPFFSYFIYPLRELIHPLKLIPLPTGGFSYPVNIIRHWSFGIYYIMAELWGSAGVPLLFWTFANSIVSFNQSKRFYPLMSLIGNFAPIISGIYVTSLAKYLKSFTPFNQDYIFERSLKYSSLVMMGSISMIALLHHRLLALFDQEKKNEKKEEKEREEKEREAFKTMKTMEEIPSKQSDQSNATVLSASTPSPSLSPEVHSSKHQKPRLSIRDSFRVLGRDKYLGNIAKMVLSYGLAIEFTEIIWKAIVKKAFPTQTEYLTFMTLYSALVGVGSTIMMIIGSNLVSSLGWKIGALTTPVVMGLVALPFYLSLIFSNYFKFSNALFIPVYFGLIQNVLSKATKYALFDPTKEMAYFPLDREAKVTGKAAIDVLCARLGKSGGAFIQQFLAVIFGSITKATPIISFLFYGVIYLWIGLCVTHSPYLFYLLPSTPSFGLNFTVVDAVKTLAPMFQTKNNNER